MKFIEKIETSRHVPPAGADPSWQESFFLGWCSADGRIGGAHHISLNPHLKLAHVWSWLVVDGKLAGRCQENKLAIPDDDLRNFRLGGHHFVAGESLRSLHLTAEYENAKLDVEYTGFHDPVEINTLRPQGRHYESMGSVVGKVEVGGQTIPIECFAWQDHSWGERNYASTLSERWGFAIFGDDLAFSIYSLKMSDGERQFGYVLDRGSLNLIRKVEARVGVADDGCTPLDCQLVVRLDNQRAYRISGVARASAVSGGPGWSGTGGFFGVNALMEYDCGGRIGEGLFEISELKVPNASIAEQLGLKPFTNA